MVYQVPKSKASIKQNRFEFSFPGERKVRSVPLLQYVRPALALKFEELGEAESVKLLFADIYPSEDLFAKFEDVEQFEAWLEEWQRQSGVTVGESSASPDSSESTAGPSDTTSFASDSDSNGSAPTT